MAAQPQPGRKRGRPRKLPPGSLAADIQKALIAQKEARASMKAAKPGVKTADDFLYPKMPGAFIPSVVARQTLGWQKERYLQVFAATMGNQSMCLFYCAWTQARFEELTAGDAEFTAAIEVERGRLTDRATYLLNKSLGLVRTEAGLTPTGNQGAATLAKVVGEMGVKAGPAAKKGYRVVVDGLARPPKPEAA